MDWPRDSEASWQISHLICTKAGPHMWIHIKCYHTKAPETHTCTHTVGQNSIWQSQVQQVVLISRMREVSNLGSTWVHFN